MFAHARTITSLRRNEEMYVIIINNYSPSIKLSVYFNETPISRIKNRWK